MAGGDEGGDCFLAGFAFDQNVIGIVSRDRKNRDRCCGQRGQKRCQHTGHRKRKRPLQLKADPALLDFSFSGRLFRRADDRYFTLRFCKRKECLLVIGNLEIRRNSAHCELARQFFKPKRVGRARVRNHVFQFIALTTAALASKRVESRVGKGESSGVMSSGISVQPSTTASQPWAARERMIS